MTTQFADLGLRPELVQATAAMGFTEATPIQAGVIPLLLEGKDVIGQAQTGTGKTAAFALPILNLLQPNKKKPQALVVAPTRELAGQVARAFTELSGKQRVRMAVCYGGQSYQTQISALRRGTDVVVGTPGRLIDLIEKKFLDLSETKMVALDEADEMLSMGFVEDIERILSETSKERQTLLFSATMPKPIRRLANKFMENPETVTIERKALTVDAIEQRHYLVRHRDRLNALSRVLEVEDVTRAIVFARTRADSSEVASALTKRGYPAEALNGDLTQQARERVLGRFRNNKIKMLVATDVAARGLDIDDISHVFNFELGDPEAYVHRIGRTGRAGKTGVAISFVTPQERGRLIRIERFAKTRIPAAELPTAEQIETKRDEQLREKVTVWLERGRCKREKAMVEGLIEAGHDPIMIAAIALKLARGQDQRGAVAEIGKVDSRDGGRRDNRRDGRRDGRGRRDERGDRGGRDRFAQRDNQGRPPRRFGNDGQEEGMVRMQLPVGKRQGIRPGDIVGTISNGANIPGRRLGAIKIQDYKSYVDVPSELVAQVLSGNGSYRYRNKQMDIEAS